MKVFAISLALAIASIVSAAIPRDRERLANIRMQALAANALNITLQGLDADVAAAKALGLKPNCTKETLSIRREFGSLTKQQRKTYTDAVLCLQTQKTNTPAFVSSGTRSRFDDFVVTHIFQTPYVHSSGTFLGWHRWYLYIYEQTLRTECSYNGPIPYWDWPIYHKSPQTSPVFDGSPYSLGGNGAFIPNRTGILMPLPSLSDNSTSIYLPTGLGGGCITSGPFVNMSVNVGPLALDSVPLGPDGGLGYNPRCLKRDISPAIAEMYTNYTMVVEVMNQDNVGDFQSLMQGKDPERADFGIHGGGHYTIGGDPGGDFYVSPGDPAFYLHHGQVDRLWYIWQAQDIANRQYALSGTNTMNNDPPSANTTLDFKINVGYADLLARNVSIKSVMSTVRGEFCYVYASTQ